MKVSILLLTINRYHLTQAYVGQALKQAGHPYDLCITDNGSSDPAILQWNEDQSPKIYNRNPTNFGTAQSLNRMIEQNPSDYYVFIGNDIRLPENWLKTLVEYAEKIHMSGVVGIDWRNGTYTSKLINNVLVNSNPTVFGTMFISQVVRDKIGKFCEDYGPYGLWDSDYSMRSLKAGFENYYIPGLSSHHFGDDVGSQEPYRLMKDESLRSAAPIFKLNIEKYEQGQIYI